MDTADDEFETCALKTVCNAPHAVVWPGRKFTKSRVGNFGFNVDMRSIWIAKSVRKIYTIWKTWKR